MQSIILESRELVRAMINLFERTCKFLYLSRSALIREACVGRSIYNDYLKGKRQWLNMDACLRLWWVLYKHIRDRINRSLLPPHFEREWWADLWQILTHQSLGFPDYQ